MLRFVAKERLLQRCVTSHKLEWKKNIKTETEKILSFIAPEKEFMGPLGIKYLSVKNLSWSKNKPLQEKNEYFVAGLIIITMMCVWALNVN